jgi:hypothetical protein
MSLIALCLSVMSGDALAGPAVRPTPFLDAVDLHLSHAAVGAPGETEGACLTGLVEEMRGEWATIPAEERAAITARLAPWKADLFAPMVRDTPMPPWGTDSCWGQQYDNRLVGRRFVVEWEDGVDEDDARSFLEALEYSYDVEVDDLGWNAPDGIDDYLMAAFITTIGSPSSTARKKPRFARTHASPSGSPIPATATAIPAARSRASPCPATGGNGSTAPATTRATPARISASVQGGVRPRWQHGSSVT